MPGRPVLLYLLLALVLALTSSLEQRSKQFYHRNHAHVRILNPSTADDSELLDREESQGGQTKKGQQKNKPLKGDDEDKPKTLSQQVADGKYGLIQKELFGKPPKRPGVLSYEDNPEVPNDNAANFGGLDKNEIWLAENHLLVLRGGHYPAHESKQHHDGSAESFWPPIDDYKAPLHQVKIPKNPSVPPPFPVPFQIFTRPPKNNQATAAPSAAQKTKTGQAADTDPTDAAAGKAKVPVSKAPPGEDERGLPLPPLTTLNGTWPPFLEYLPPGAVILPPPDNRTEQIDDEDPSIYYPPPYTFFYRKDNASVVPPGPLVPGIILPPPPDFFAPLEEEEATTKATTKNVKKTQRTRKPITTLQMNTQIHPTTTPLPPTASTEKPLKVYPVKTKYYMKEANTSPPKVATVLPVRQDRIYLSQKRPQLQDVTILQPVKSSTVPPPKVYVYENEIPNKPYVQYATPTKKKVVVSTTQVPLKYYSTSNSIEVSTGPHKTRTVKTTPKARVVPTQYFYYEEQEKIAPSTSPKPNNDYYQEYYVPPTPSQPPRRPQYVYVPAKPYNTQKPRFRPVKPTNSFSIHIAKIQQQISQYTTARPSPKPVYQFSFEANNYKTNKNKFRPSPPEQSEDQFRPIPKYSVEIQQAIEITPSTEPTRSVYQEYQAVPANYQIVPSTTVVPPESYQQVQVVSNGKPPQVEIIKSTELPYYQQTTDKPSGYYPTPKHRSRPISQYSFAVTPNPIYQGFYTKPDQEYFDENTKNYFTMFGKKLPASTTPIPIELTRAPAYLQQARRPSLEADTLVNYVRPKPTVEPAAEIIVPPEYPKVVRYPAYRQQPKAAAEIVKAIPIEVPSDDVEGSFISYQLPGDNGAHFYFLTPQLAERTNQGAGFYYSRDENSRKRRNGTKDDYNG